MKNEFPDSDDEQGVPRPGRVVSRLDPSVSSPSPSSGSPQLASGSLLVPQDESPYDEAELRVLRRRLAPKPAAAAIPAAPTPEKSRVPERFHIVWFSGNTLDVLSKEAQRNLLDFQDHCENLEAVKCRNISQLEFFIPQGNHLYQPPFTGHQVVGSFEINLKAGDGQILKKTFLLYIL